MQKLTAKKAKVLIAELSGLRTIREELYRQALVLALPELDRQEVSDQTAARAERDSRQQSGSGKKGGF